MSLSITSVMLLVCVTFHICSPSFLLDGSFVTGKLLIIQSWKSGGKRSQQLMVNWKCFSHYTVESSSPLQTVVW